jgi:hypothetical protein
MELPHDDIFAQIERWCAKNKFLKRCKVALSILFAVREPQPKKSGVYRLFNKAKLLIVENIRLRDMPRGTTGKINTFDYVIRRNRNELYLNPNSELREKHSGNHTVSVGRLKNGKFVISCLKNNLPIFKNAWFAHGFRITKIKYGKFIRMELAKKEELEKIAAIKEKIRIKKEKKESAKKAQRIEHNKRQFQEQQRRRNQNQYRYQYPQNNRFNSVRRYW